MPCPNAPQALHAPSTHNRATSGSESHADAQTNDSTSPSSFAGHGSAVPLLTDSNASSNRNAPNVATCGTGPSVLRVNRNACATQTVITYREYVTHRTSPRDLAHEIIARSLASPAAPTRASALLRTGLASRPRAFAFGCVLRPTRTTKIQQLVILSAARSQRFAQIRRIAINAISHPHAKKSTPSTSLLTPSPAAPTKPPSPTKWATSSPPPVSRAPSPPTTIASAAGC